MMQYLDVTISVQKVKGFLTTTEWMSLIVAVIFAGVIAGLATVNLDMLSQTQSANKLRTRCTTPACLDAAIWLMENVDENVSPCQYFYDNACLNYSRRVPVPMDGDAGTNVLTAMREENRKRLHSILQTPFVPGQWGDLDRTADRANSYYTACINKLQQGSTNYPGSNPLTGIIDKQMGYSKWWVLDPKSTTSLDHESIMQRMAINQNFVFFHLKPVLANGEKSKFYLTFYPDQSPSFRFMAEYYPYYESQRRKQRFIDIVTNLGLLLARDYGLNVTTDVKTNVAQFATDVYYVIDKFEEEVNDAMKYGDQDTYRQEFAWGDWKTAVGDGFDFDKYVKQYTGIDFSSGTRVMEHYKRRYDFYTKDVLSDLRVFKKYESNFDRRMNNYLVFRIAFYWMPHMSYEYSHLYRQYLTLADGTTEFPADWETCLELTTQHLPKALSALYISDYYDSDTHSTIKRINHMLNHSLYTELDTLQWMDDDTRNAAKRKLRGLVFKIGKPSTWENDSAIANEMERHYNGITLDSLDHLGNVQKLIPIRKNEDIRKLTNGANPIDDWRAELYETRVEYFDRWNEILIPAGAIQEPLVSKGYPAFMNFGGIGTWIASAMISAIDEAGQALDENNNANAWWTQTTWANYAPLKNTIIDFYNISTPLLLQEEINVTEYATAGIRETGGIRQAYLAYQRYVGEYGIDEQALPSLSHGNIIQNFFYAYAGSHCDAWSSEAVWNARRHQIMPTFIRVDGGVAQFDQFAAAFQCPNDDSRMVPPKAQRAFVF